MKTTPIALALVIGAALLACNPKPDTSSQNDTTEIVKDPVDTTLAKATETNSFAEQAAIGGMMEVESSAKMIKFTENPDVQNLATIMVKDHGAANAELKAIVKKEKLFIPQSLPAVKQNELTKLDSLQEEEANRAYAALMVKEHQQAVALFAKASETESNPALKAFAAKHLPILKAHMAHAESLNKMMQQIKNDKGDLPIKEKNRKP